jgi:hypothetical protein
VKLQAVDARDLFINAIKGKLEITTTDLFPYIKALGIYYMIPEVSHNLTAPDSKPHTNKVDLVISRRALWLIGSEVKKNLRIGTESYECTINYSTIFTHWSPNTS